MTRDGVYNYWNYCTWAMNEGLETQYKESDKSYLDAFVPAAAIWVFILGKQLYDREDEQAFEKVHVKVGGKMKLKSKLREPDFSKAKWRSWKQRFGELAGDEMLKAETRDIARKAQLCYSTSKKPTTGWIEDGCERSWKR